MRGDNLDQGLLDQALQLVKLGRTDEAMASFDRLVEQCPNVADAHAHRAELLLKLGRFAESIEGCRRALGHNPNLVKAHGVQGRAQEAVGQFEQALGCFEAAIAREPDHALAFWDRARMLRALGRGAEALASLDQALALAPSWSEAWSLRGVVLRELGRRDESVQSLDRALSLRQDVAWVWSYRGLAAGELGRVEEALENQRTALSLQSDHPEIWSNLATVLNAAQRHQEALECHDRAGALGPRHPQVQLHRSMMHLLMGRFDTAWNGWEWRQQVPDSATPRLPGGGPVWDGQQPLSGRSMLLVAEQGRGDTIQFCRYAPLLARSGARVTLQVQPELRPLLDSLAGIDRVMSLGEPAAADFQCGLMSLPALLNTTLDTIPASTPYLDVPSEREADCRRSLGPARARRIGLVCSGNAQHHNDGNRSVPLERIAEALAGLDVELHLLQPQLRPADERSMQIFGIVDHRGRLNDFLDAAALVRCMDAVVSVDTAGAHLAGALGVPLYLLLCAVPDWRWMLDRPDSPWYPSARLLRQAVPGRWDEPLQRLREHLSTPEAF